MASSKIHLSVFLFLSLLLVFSPQIQARHAKIFSLFSHFRLSNNANDFQVILKKAKAIAPATAPALAPGPAGIPVSTPVSEPVSTPAPGPAGPDPILPVVVPVPVPVPAPEPEGSDPLFFPNKGDSYGLYGVDSAKFSPTKETPAAASTKRGSDQNELLNEEEFRTGYPKTNLYSNNNYNSEETYRNNYNSEDLYRSNHYSNNGYSKNYNGQYYSGNNNGYERKREGMSDTRFMENGKYYYDVKNNIDNRDTYYNNLNGYKSEERGSTENEGYYEKNKYSNEFNAMEEYKKQQQSQRYVP